MYVACGLYVWCVCSVQLFKSQILPHVVDMTALRQHLVALKDQSPIPAECLCRPVSEANEKWNSIVRGIRKREVTERGCCVVRY